MIEKMEESLKKKKRRAFQKIDRRCEATRGTVLHYCWR